MRRLGHWPGVAIAVFLVSLASSTWEFPIGSDGSAMFATAESLVTRGSLAIDARFTLDDGYNPSAKRGTDGQTYGKYGLGLPLIEAPLIVVADLAARALGTSHALLRAVLLSLINPLLTALCAILIAAISERLGAARPAATLAALGYVFGSFAWVYAVGDGTEALLAVLVASAAWALVAFEQTGREDLLWIGGTALAWGVLTKPVVASLAPPFVFAAIVARAKSGNDWKQRTLGAAGLAVPIALVLAFIAWLNWLRFGSIAETGYNTPVLTHPILNGLYGLLVSPNKGLVFYAPLVLVAPFSVVSMWRRSPPLAIASTLGTVLWLGLSATFYDWGGGWCWGPRYLVPVLPLLFVGVGLHAGRIRTRVPIHILLGAGVIVNLLGVVVSEDAYRRTTMEVWLADVTGYETAGSAQEPGTMVSVPRPPEDVLPRFSSILGHWWLLRAALQGCDCSAMSGECACRMGSFETNRVFLDPPWKRAFPDVVPRPPYGVSVVQPALVRRAAAWWWRS